MGEIDLPSYNQGTLMKKIIVFAMVILSASLYATTRDKVVYGEDDRIDVYESNNDLYIQLAKSTAAKVSDSNIEDYNATQVRLAGKTLEEQGVCASERFSQQPTVGRCTGFLVADNILVTAGHCALDQESCNGISWVFDYKVDFAEQSEVILDKENVYKCKRIIQNAYNENTKEDYAVIELDRRTVGRTPFNFRIKTGKNGPFVGTKLAVIGNPSGLPTKISDGAWIRSIKTVYLNANLDTFAGNSGSPVIDRTTGMVEGILVRGETDYVYDDIQGCDVVNRVANDYDTGEGVTRITIIKNLRSIVENAMQAQHPIPSPTPEEPAPPVVTKDPWWQRLLTWLRNIF